MNPSPSLVAQWIEQGLACTHLAVEGDGRHFQALIVATAFEGLSPLKRHQLVYAALGDRMHETIHALSMRTLTPAQWAAQAGAGERDSSIARPRSDGA
jgi:acid stress-induced BolA-like protein IbaG/YrbA